MTKNGILCEVNEKRVYLDPKKTDLDGINFVSHAHSDHLPSKNGGTILSSIETSAISDLRGFTMKNHVEFLDGFSLIDSGHVLGSKGLLFDDIFYTGDICTRDRGFLKAAKIPSCKTLITECTFGLPEFTFPKMDEIQKSVDSIPTEVINIEKVIKNFQLENNWYEPVPILVNSTCSISDDDLFPQDFLDSFALIEMKKLYQLGLAV